MRFIAIILIFLAVGGVIKLFIRPYLLAKKEPEKMVEYHSKKESPEQK